MDVSNVCGEGRGGGDGDEEVALCILDIGVGGFMVVNDALRTRSVVSWTIKISLTKGK